ncbi:aminotransferase class I/II-fold pyridoxal phosphate-dependent enzyme [Amycolatopsis pithecellobii]|uniref:GntR family transcriptional regulator n=1 Tax=Amycolatopsis pithecellobii TaxID=664692 RepID=A0A6N7YXH9_9PSEU|nr:aminotransferase class I/II-fold pyridoxal phosphate-dependent enzyme [Amycolatopsis pithecellobii]MTD53039.1 GntR family transcriptional regulator [Amycolatopsis pithecellobii]
MVEAYAAAELPPGDVIPARWLAQHIHDATARGIVAAVTDLIRHRGEVKDRYLPTVRNLAGTLQISPATVAKAWRVLGEAGLISTNGSQGTRVVGEEPPGHRLESVIGGLPMQLDLMSPSPDPELLPDIEPHLAAVMSSDVLGDFNKYGGDMLVAPLAEYARRTWPFDPGMIVPCGGCYDGVLLLLDVLARPGTRVAVESPTAAPVLDQLEYLRCEIVPVPADGEGMIPSALAEAGDVEVVVIQSRFSSPDGHTMTADRAGELAGILRKRPTVPVVIESDPAPLLAAGPGVSLGNWLPDRVVLVRGWNKSHGPDLRVALIGGAPGIVQLARRRRAMGSVWTSRLLQGTLSLMLADDGVARTVAAAAGEYRQRRAALARELSRLEIDTYGTEGFSLWVGVQDEHTALRVLRAYGISAAGGSAFTQLPARQHHLRIATTQLPVHHAAEVALAVREAATASRAVALR